ncbi:MAG: hypothetical protein HY835_04735, partial [Anaerolineae bacterium]|nr:hypothetical protein [Anaerolineae bacterium]
MHRRKLALVCFWIICLGLILPGWGHVPQRAAQAQGISSAALNLVAPAACPAGGCAAGQRLSYRLEYTLGQYDGLTDLPNVKVCLYVPNNWYDAASVQLDANGGVTGAAYTNTGVCSEDPLPPTNYSLLAAGEAKFYLTNVFNDSLGLSFRLAPTASVSGSVLLRVFERTGPAAWTRTSQVFTSQSSPVATAATVYVAPDAASCPSGPCYLNSAGDAASGLGTGLKDAVDAAAPGSRIVVVGAATVKGNTVAVNKSLILEGQGNASLTGTGGCSNALVNFTAGGTLRGLNLQDGTCSAPDRPLVTINSPVDFLVEYNTFNSGSEALRITDNTGNLTVRFNQFNGISGKVLVWGSGSSPAALSMTANNIVGSPAGEMVECSEGGTAVIANRRVDHNYWSSGLPTTASHCVITPNKQLGAPAAQRANLPGVNASRVTVTNTKTYFMNNQVALQRSTDGADFDMLLVDHGRSVPFDQGRTTGSPIPCSNYYDIFLAEGAAPAGSLDISLKYNSTTACVAVVESSQYCELSTNTAKFPLYWYEPSGTVTAGWDTTGQNPAGSAAGGATGQTTVCDSAVDEVRVSVDNTGRPSLSADLNFTPFMVGIPIP